MIDTVIARVFTSHSFRVMYLLLTMLCCGSIASCTSRKNDPVQLSQVNFDAAVHAITYQHLVPLTDEFGLQSSVFENAAKDLCSGYALADLLSVQSQWRLLNQVWFALSNYKFGPMISDVVFPRYTFIDSYRLRGTNYLASVRQDILADVSADNALSSEYFSSKTFQYVGLLPLEVLIFETLDGATDIDEVVSEFRDTPRKCEILLQLSAQLVSRANAIQSDWGEGYGVSEKPYAVLFESGELAAGETPIYLLLTSVQEHLDYLNKRNVIANSSTLAGTAWSSMRAALEDISAMLGGEQLGSFTLYSLMQSAGQGATVEEVRENINFGLVSIDERDAVNLQLALSLLDGNFKRNIPNALDVNLGINFSDGD